MTVISSKEFVSNEDNYFGLAMEEQVFINMGNNMFTVTIINRDEDDGDDGDAADLALAMSRRNDEMTSSQDFRKFLKSLP